jgi:hypothetical protein
MLFYILLVELQLFWMFLLICFQLRMTLTSSLGFHSWLLSFLFSFISQNIYVFMLTEIHSTFKKSPHSHGLCAKSRLILIGRFESKYENFTLIKYKKTNSYFSRLFDPDQTTPNMLTMWPCLPADDRESIFVFMRHTLSSIVPNCILSK